MKLKKWLIIAAGIISLGSIASAHCGETKCQRKIEEVMKKYVMVSPEEREKMYGDFGECLKVPGTLEEFLQKLENEGYASKNEFLGKITKPIEILVDGGREYKVITYKPIVDPNKYIATNYLNRILINEGDVNKIVERIMKLVKSGRNPEDISDKLGISMYLSQKGADNNETASNLYSNIAQNYAQHELRHVKNHDEASNAVNETKAYLFSLARSPSYNAFIDLHWLTQREMPVYTETARRIFKEFADRGLPIEKIPETSLDEIKAVAGEIYKEL
jgi:hypothetical protein